MYRLNVKILFKSGVTKIYRSKFDSFKNLLDDIIRIDDISAINFRIGVW